MDDRLLRHLKKSQMQTLHLNLMQQKKNEVEMMRTGFQGLLVLSLHLSLATRTNKNIGNYYRDDMIFVETNLGDILNLPC